MNALHERLTTCPAGRRIVMHHVHPLVAEVSEEPFIALSDGRLVGLGESRMVFLNQEKRQFFQCSQCIAWNPQGCDVGLNLS